MKNKLHIIFILFILFSTANAENLIIEAKSISLDKSNNTSIFKDGVIIKTSDDKILKSDYVKYDKSKGFLILNNNIEVEDGEKNIIKANQAEYFEKDKIFKTIGSTYIETPSGYLIEGEDFIFDNKKKSINSEKKSIIKDSDGNRIYLENFNYQTQEFIFKSIGLIKIEDKLDNTYEFSQIYIDTKKKEILGTDIKAFLNHEDFKINSKNKPRVFSNSIKLEKNRSQFNKSVFTLCNYRKDDKCPPWSIQAGQMLHDNKKKTIYYDNAIVKVYDIPIFYFPRFSHPDPTVERRSGFLPPVLSDSKNLGTGISIPYFFDLAKDKNFTFTSRVYPSENPLLLGEYHQVFENSNFLADFGFTEGYKNTSVTKKEGSKSHIFSKFITNFKGKNNSENSFGLTYQDVSNDKYLKLYKISSNFVDYNQDTLENSINFLHDSDDLFLGINASMFETLKETYEDKYEYIFPEITLDKNLLNDDRLGSVNLQTNLKVHNYDTNKLTNFFINDLNWSSNEILYKSVFKNRLLGNIKNINYEAKNLSLYKNDPTSEFYAALGLLSQVDLKKEDANSIHILSPKILLRLSPGSMRKEESGSRLNPINAFSLSRLDNVNNFETGLSASLGIDYNIKNGSEEFDFSIAQIINEKENKNMPDKTSLNEKLSDLVGSVSYKLNNNFKLNYNFSVDQNYNDINYSEIGTNMDFGPVNFDFNYLQEKKHIGNQDYFKTKINLKNKNDGIFSFETKRNLITNSAEFYNLSYEYINDCLRAGLVYRREFYNDSELEPENSLMFKITLTPFGSINSPTFSK